MRYLPLSCVLAFALPCLAQKPLEAKWGKLVDQKKYAEAEQLCKTWTKSPTLSTRVEAQKCLANVALCKGQILQLMGNDNGGGSIGQSYKPQAVDEAIAHLNEGIRLDSGDLTLHKGRLFILESAGRFDQMAKALDESAALVPGPDVLQDWLPYSAELADSGQFKAGLQLCEVLNKHYPNSHDVIGNIGAFHNMLKEPNEALPYLLKAVELAPSDPIDTWDLGHVYDNLGQNELAEKWYTTAISLDPVGKEVPDRNCIYAEFVEKKLNDKARACKLQKASCDEERQTACSDPKQPSAPQLH